jgi:hypothetical protein
MSAATKTVTLRELCGEDPLPRAAAAIAQSVKRLARGWTVWGSNPVETGPGAHPASCTIATVSFRE